MGRAKWWLEDPKRILIALALSIVIGGIVSALSPPQSLPPVPINQK